MDERTMDEELIKQPNQENNRSLSLVKKEEEKMDKYTCIVCGYVYDPAVGDSDGGIEAGTSFDDLPADWVCPLCGVGKDQFEKE